MKFTKNKKYTFFHVFKVLTKIKMFDTLSNKNKTFQLY